MKPKVVCVGLATLDRLYAVERLPTAPTRVFASAYQEIGGGPAATAAVTIAKLGGQAEFWGRVGDDRTGDAILAELEQYGVGVSHAIRVRGAASPSAAALIDREGERLIVSFIDPRLDADPVAFPRELLGDAVAVLADMRWPEGAIPALRAAREQGIRSVLDGDLAPEPSARTLIGIATHAIFSRPALRRFMGAEDVEDGLRRAQQWSQGMVGVTLGGEGHAWLERGIVRRVPGLPVRVTDSLGAGDVFHGAYALALAEGLDELGAGRFANAAAALKCTRFGGRAGIPTRAEVNAFLEIQ